ncbi:hypothetical protein J6590_061985 [Homalodisca vitripennis]|nr:hypothetical protein J6590_061985 [Homalodisca vitripennis]
MPTAGASVTKQAEKAVCVYCLRIIRCHITYTTVLIFKASKSVNYNIHITCTTLIGLLQLIADQYIRQNAKDGEGDTKHAEKGVTYVVYRQSDGNRCDSCEVTGE